MDVDNLAADVVTLLANFDGSGVLTFAAGPLLMLSEEFFGSEAIKGISMLAIGMCQLSSGKECFERGPGEYIQCLLSSWGETPQC